MKIGHAVRMLMPIITQFGKTATKKLKKRILAQAAERQRGCFRGSLVGGLAAPALFCCWSAAVTGQLPGGACGARG